MFPIIFSVEIVCIAFVLAIPHTNGLMMKPDYSPKPASISGIRNVRVEPIAHRRRYAINVSFIGPQYTGKSLKGYTYTIYRHSNTTHRDRVPLKNTTFLAPDATTFKVKGMRYNAQYDLEITVVYEEEANNIAYAEFNHFNYANDSKGYMWFTSTDISIHAPPIDDSKVKKLENGLFEIYAKWRHPNEGYIRVIYRFVVCLYLTENNRRIATGVIEVGQVLNYTFPSVPSAEYRVAIFPIFSSKATGVSDYMASSYFLYLY